MRRGKEMAVEWWSGEIPWEGTARDPGGAGACSTGCLALCLPYPTRETRQLLLAEVLPA